MSSDGPIPMFPLGSVLFPHVGLPLRVFEPRYRQLVLDCLEQTNEFGVVLIERGSEVGGGDTRFDVGTIAEIVDASPEPDGTWSVLAVGRRPIRIERWLEDAPYPRAIAQAVDEPGLTEAEVHAVAVVVERLRASLRLCAKARVAAMSPDTTLNDDPAVALWQACALAPIGPIDELALLRSATTMQRITLLASLLDDHDALLAHRIDGS